LYLTLGLLFLEGGKLSYYFELSVRKSSNKASKNSLYITYLGSGEFVEDKGVDDSFWKEQLKSPDSGVLPILSDVSCNDLSLWEGRSPFSTFSPGCGAVELSQHGVQPLHTKGVYDLRHSSWRRTSL
jgi:hypothetical protein